MDGLIEIVRYYWRQFQREMDEEERERERDQETNPDDNIENLYSAAAADYNQLRHQTRIASVLLVMVDGSQPQRQMRWISSHFFWWQLEETQPCERSSDVTANQVPKFSDSADSIGLIHYYFLSSSLCWSTLAVPFAYKIASAYLY